MRAFLLGTAAFLIVGSAQAQTVSTTNAGSGASSCGPTSCALTGTLTAATVNATSIAGYEQYGSTILTSTLNGAATGALSVGVGAGGAATSSNSEDTYCGGDAGHVDTGNQNFYCGAFAAGYSISGSFNTGTADDVFRNITGMSSNSAYGKSAMATWWGNRDVADGQQALFGNSAALLIGGTPTAGDVITVNVVNSGLPGGTQPFSTTVTSAETPAQIVAALVTSMTANTNLSGDNFLPESLSTISSLAPVMGIIHQGTNSTGDTFTVTASVSGSATETVTVSYMDYTNSSDNIGRGYYALAGIAAVSPHLNLCDGSYSCASLTTGYANVADGQGGVLENATTGNNNDCGGYATCVNLTTAIGATVRGSGAGGALTTAPATLYGYQAGASVVTGSPDIFGSVSGVNLQGVRNSIFGDGSFKGATNSTANQINSFGQLNGGSSVSSANNIYVFGNGNLGACTSCQHSAFFGGGLFNSTWQSGSDVMVFSTRGFDAGSASESNEILFRENGGANNFSITGTSTPSTQTVTIPGSTIVMANLTQSAAAQTGTVCWSAAGITYDATLGCLSSSARFKGQIADLGDGLSEVMRMRPVSFVYTANPADKARQVGLIAEEVNAVDPRLVGYEADGVTPRGVRYAEYTAMLTKAIQQQQAEIDALRVKIH